MASQLPRPTLDNSYLPTKSQLCHSPVKEGEGQLGARKFDFLLSVLQHSTLCYCGTRHIRITDFLSS